MKMGKLKMKTIDPSIRLLLKKVNVVNDIENVKVKSCMLFGTGGFARKIATKYDGKLTHVLDYKEGNKINFSSLLTSHVRQAYGTVILGSGNGSYQYNQIKALAEYQDQIDTIILIDPYLTKRNIPHCFDNNTVVLLEHADGIERHGRHTQAIRCYLLDKGKNVISLCPLTLNSYNIPADLENIIVWGGQREQYDIVDDYFDNERKTYIEYGFFPQSQHFYLDKVGVNQSCSLMNDSLDWVSKSHLERLELLKSSYFLNYRHQAQDYILVPLQVPDDANIVNCSRFTNGMQEFIDYIVSYYPSNQNLLFKAHPKDPCKDSYCYHGNLHSDKPFVDLLQHASHVHGITSSTLYEAALAGVDIITEGRSLLSVHKEKLPKLFAAMVDRQAKIDEFDLSYVINQYSHLSLG